VTEPATLILTGREVEALLPLRACRDAVEGMLRSHAEGRTAGPGSASLQVPGGEFHVKVAASLPGRDGRGYFAAKVNGNFPSNREQRRLPTIQGVLVLSSAEDGRVLALMDSIEITALRTAAVTALAARYLASPRARVVAVVGCGRQGRAQLRALADLLPLRRVLVYDHDHGQAERFAREMSESLSLAVEVAGSAGAAARESEVCVTCTTARQPVLSAGDLRPGAFLAAVGADAPDKQELDPRLLAAATVVVDSRDQCAASGELHHALEAGVLRREQVHGELHEIVAGTRPGRRRDDETIVFDSTGTALQDVAAAVLVYETARDRGLGLEVRLGA
jgi:alanine dehydrogenase